MQKLRVDMLVISFVCLTMPFGAFGYLSANAAKVSETQ